MKPGLAVTILILVFTLSVPAQTAVELERILGLPAVNYGDAAWAVLGTAGIALPEDSPDGAYRFAADRGWLPKKARPEEAVTLGGVSFLIMRAFAIRGGLMYTLFPGPRYACRELVRRGLVKGYSTMKVSGEEFLRILSRTPVAFEEGQ